MIVIRPAIASDAHGIATVHVESWRSTYTGIVAQAYLDGLSVADRMTMWERHFANQGPGRSTVLVAVNDGAVVGFIAGGPVNKPPFDSKIHALYLMKDAQRCGTGRMLMRAWATAALERGLKATHVEVVERNPACKFYEHLGAKHVSDAVVVIAGQKHAEKCYAWHDLRTLVAPAT